MQHVAEQGGKWQNRGQMAKQEGKWQKWHNRRTSSVCSTWQNRGVSGKELTLFLAIIKNFNQNIEAKVFSHIHYGANIPFIALYLLDALKICMLRQSLEYTKLVEAKENEEPVVFY